jgi:hypothetical protein
MKTLTDRKQYFPVMACNAVDDRLGPETAIY